MPRSKLFISQHEIYDIGTKILYFQCFVTTDMFLFCKPIFFSGICHMFRDIAFGSVKTRFKAILKKSNFRFEFACGQLAWSLSNQISCDICSKQV